MTGERRRSLAQSLLSELMDISAALGELRARIIHLEGQIHTKISSPTSHSIHDPANIQAAERVISILPSMWQVITWVWHVVLWMAPGFLVGWGMVEGWLAVAWRFLRTSPL